MLGDDLDLVAAVEATDLPGAQVVGPVRDADEAVADRLALDAGLRAAVELRRRATCKRLPRRRRVGGRRRERRRRCREFDRAAAPAAATQSPAVLLAGSAIAPGGRTEGTPPSRPSPRRSGRPPPCPAANRGRSPGRSRCRDRPDPIRSRRVRHGRPARRCCSSRRSAGRRSRLRPRATAMARLPGRGWAGRSLGPRSGRGRPRAAESRRRRGGRRVRRSAGGRWRGRARRRRSGRGRRRRRVRRGRRRRGQG